MAQPSAPPVHTEKETDKKGVAEPSVTPPKTCRQLTLYSRKAGPNPSGATYYPCTRFHMYRTPIVSHPSSRYPAAYHRKVISPESNTSQAPARNHSAAASGTHQRRRTSCPAMNPASAINNGFTPKNNNKHPRNPISFRKTHTTSHGSPTKTPAAASVQPITSRLIPKASPTSFSVPSIPQIPCSPIPN